MTSKERAVLDVLNADLAPWTFDGSGPMVLRLFEVMRLPEVGTVTAVPSVVERARTMFDADGRVRLTLPPRFQK